jgi:hypothetical protein
LPIRRPDGQLGAGHDHQAIVHEGAPDQTLVGIRIHPDHQVIAFLDHVDGRSSVVTSSRTSGTSREPGGQLAHRGLREQQRRADPQRPRGMSRADAIAGRGSSSSVSKAEVRSYSARPSWVSLSVRRRARTGAGRGGLQLATRRDKVALGRRAARAARPNPAVAGDQVEVREGKQVHVFHQ